MATALSIIIPSLVAAAGTGVSEVLESKREKSRGKRERELATIDRSKPGFGESLIDKEKGPSVTLSKAAAQIENDPLLSLRKRLLK